jgi:hypothetical protein
MKLAYDYKSQQIIIIIRIFDIMHRPVFYLKPDASETGFCLRPQDEPTQLSLIESSLPNVLF